MKTTFMFIWFSCLSLILDVSFGFGSAEFEQVDRYQRSSGVPYNLFGNSRQAAVDEIHGFQNIAELSAQYAVTSSIGQHYGQQQNEWSHLAKRYLHPPIQTTLQVFPDRKMPLRIKGNNNSEEKITRQYPNTTKRHNHKRKTNLKRRPTKIKHSTSSKIESSHSNFKNSKQSSNS